MLSPQGAYNLMEMYINPEKVKLSSNGYTQTDVYLFSEWCKHVV